MNVESNMKVLFVDLEYSYNVIGLDTFKHIKTLSIPADELYTSVAMPEHPNLERRTKQDVIEAYSLLPFPPHLRSNYLSSRLHATYPTPFWVHLGVIRQTACARPSL